MLTIKQRSRYIWWIIGGVVGLVIVLSVLLVLWSNRITRRLAKEVQKGDSAIIDMQRITDFPWDQMYIFPPYCSHQYIENCLGFDWDDVDCTNINYYDGICLVVFVRDKHVSYWFEHPRNQGDLIRLASPAGYSPKEARFQIHLEGEERRVVLHKLSE